MKASTLLVMAVAISLAFVASSAPAEEWNRGNDPFMRLAAVDDNTKMLLETSSSARIKSMVARMRRADGEESSEATEESSEATQATEESSEATQPAQESSEATQATEESSEVTQATEESSEATQATEESSEVTQATESSEESSQAAVTQELQKEQQMAAQELADAAAKQQQSAAEEQTKSADAALQSKNMAEENEKQERRVKEKADIEFQRIKAQAEALQKQTVQDAKEKAQLIIREAEAKQDAKKVKVVVQKTCCENCANDPCQGNDEQSESSSETSWVDAEIAVPADQGAALAEQLADLGLSKKLSVDSRVFKTAQAVLDASTARHAAFEEKHKKDCKGPICPFADGKTVQANAVVTQ